jgi:hypothetical protein
MKPELSLKGRKIISGRESEAISEYMFYSRYIREKTLFGHFILPLSCRNAFRAMKP